VDHTQILEIVHRTAAQLMAAQGGEVAQDPAAGAAAADSFIDRYGFSSLDALKFLLILEEKFQITLADEDFDEEVLYSATALAERVAALQLAQLSRQRPTGDPATAASAASTAMAAAE
jgi:acyl carrier protein